MRAAVLAVRPYGRAILMGGVRDDVALSYGWIMRECIEVRGQWMFPRDATRRMVGLIRAGLVRLEDFAMTEFSLDKVNEAVAHAAANTGPFQMTVVRP